MSTPKTLFSLAALAALSLLGAGPASAAGEFIDAPAPALSVTTRVAVQADLLAARSAGNLAAAGEGLAADQALATGNRSRAGVIAELQTARATGTLLPAGEGVAPSRKAPASRSVAQGTAAVMQ